MINNDCKGGIIIIPLNFLSSIRKNDIELRKRFISKYDIVKLNIFEERVFDDTSYSVCSFLFLKSDKDDNKTKCMIYPSKKEIEFELNEDNNYTIGGEIYSLETTDNYKITRATKLTENKDCITNILLKCLDDNIDNKISLSYIEDNDKDKYIDKTRNLTNRSYALLVIEPKIDKKTQLKLIKKFNKYLNKKREKYNSLFLTNYRESNSIARKRISFELSFKICNYLLE